MTISFVCRELTRFLFPYRLPLAFSDKDIVRCKRPVMNGLDKYVMLRRNSKLLRRYMTLGFVDMWVRVLLSYMEMGNLLEYLRTC